MANCHDCSGHISNPSVCQTLDELEFERGIWSAAVDGDVEKIRNHISKGVNPNSTDSSGYAPLHYASRNGHIQACKVLLDQGADVNLSTKSGLSTPLHRAAMRGHIDVIALLLGCGADVMLQDADGKTALHKAVENDHGNVCRVLIEACQQCIEITDNKNRKAVDYAKGGSLISGVFK